MIDHLIHAAQVLLIVAIAFGWGLRVGLGEFEPTATQEKWQKGQEHFRWSMFTAIIILLLIRGLG